jgi:hypothetical protein
MTDETIKNPPQSNADCSAATALPWLTATLLFWPIALVGAALDLWSKWAIFNWLPTLTPYRYVIIDGQTVPEFRYTLIDGFLYCGTGGGDLHLFYEKYSVPADAVRLRLYDQRHHRQPL